MTTYKQISGTTVQSNSGTLDGAADGQLWYDSTNKDFKYSYGATSLVGSWATGNDINTARASVGGTGLQTAALTFGGFNPAITPTPSALTESYNGTSWTEVNDLNQARTNRGGGLGIQTSALAVTGSIPPGSTLNESWNGTSWTEVGDINTLRFNTQSAGADNTSGLIFGGEPGSASNALTESWNGTSWTEVNDLNTQRKTAGGVGIQTSALCISGDNDVTGSVSTAATESWNGTSWTEVNDVNTARRILGAAGIQTSALLFGGTTTPTDPNNPTIYGNTELWNGTTWSETNDLNSARYDLGGAGTQTAGLAFAGRNPPTTYLTASEEFTTSTVAAGAWSTGGNMNTGRDSHGGAGTQTSALAFSGETNNNKPTTKTESYDGASWTEVNDLNTHRTFAAGAGADNTAVLGIGGDVGPPGGSGGTEFFAGTESWNGTNWTEVNDMNTGKTQLGAAGIQTAALAFGGNFPIVLANTESWNGTNWTEVNDLNTARRALSGAGIQTAALAIGGFPPYLAVTESWNGTNWTEVNDLNTSKGFVAAAGTQTSALSFGGISSVSPNISLTESWNGTSWTEVNDLSTGRSQFSGAGTNNTSALAIAGIAGTPSAQEGIFSTEEWNDPGTIIQTITTE